MKDVLEMFVKDTRVCKQLVEIAEKNEATVTLEKGVLSGTTVRLTYRIYLDLPNYVNTFEVRLGYYWNNKRFALSINIKSVSSYNTAVHHDIDVVNVGSIEKYINSLLLENFVKDEIKRYTGIKKLLEEKLK